MSLWIWQTKHQQQSTNEKETENREKKEKKGDEKTRNDEQPTVDGKETKKILINHNFLTDETYMKVVKNHGTEEIRKSAWCSSIKDNMKKVWVSPTFH